MSAWLAQLINLLAAVQLLLVFAMLGVLMGFWIALVPAFVVGIVALFRIRPERFRGQGMAISAVLISLLFGGKESAEGHPDVFSHAVGSVLGEKLAADFPEGGAGRGQTQCLAAERGEEEDVPVAQAHHIPAAGQN